MKIENKKLENIIPYGFNNRIHNDTQIERIARSIKEFGFNQPIVVDEDGIVLVGHGRLEAAKSLGLTDAPTLTIKNLSDEQKRAYRILDNKLQNDSVWNFENVELELKLLEESGFELEPWGLDDLKELFGSTEGEEFDETIAEGVEMVAIFKIRVHPEDSEDFESELDKLIKKYPRAERL